MRAVLRRVPRVLRLWRTWWAAACVVTAYGAITGRAMVQDVGTLTLAALIIVLAWKGPAWWREAGGHD